MDYSLGIWIAGRGGFGELDVIIAGYGGGRTRYVSGRRACCALERRASSRGH